MSDLREEEPDWRHAKCQHCADDGVQATEQTGFTGSNLVMWVKTEHDEFTTRAKSLDVPSHSMCFLYFLDY